MKHKTLFRMMLKAVGVLVFIQGLGTICSYLAYAAVGPSGLFYTAFGALSGLVPVVLGIYLFFGGKWIADKAIPGNRPYCHECGYDLRNAAGNLCSECGTPFRPAEVSSAP